MIRKWLAMLTACVLLLVVPITAAAQVWTPEDPKYAHFTVEVPDDLYIITSSTSMLDPIWEKINIDDPAEVIKLFSQDTKKGGMNAIANFLSADGKTSILVKCKISEESERIHHFYELEEGERNEFTAKMADVKDERITAVSSLYDQGEMPFFHVRIDGVVPAEDHALPAPGQENGREVHERIYGTIINGYMLDFDAYKIGEAIPQETEETLKQIVDSVKFTTLMSKEEKREAMRADLGTVIGPLILLLVLVFVIIGSIVFVRVRTKREQRQKRQLAEKLSAYHRTHPTNAVEGELLFANMTECTNEAIRKFSIYQAYVKNIWPFVLGIGMAIILLIAAIVTNGDWMMILIAVVILGFYVYKLFTASTVVERVQRKIYSSGTSTTAKYAFYDEAFRVSGIQSVAVYPYFQITEARVTSEYIYLYYGPDNAYILARDSFVTGKDTAFIQFIKEKIKHE